MKAVVYRKYGSPDVLKVKDVETPVPNENEVLIKTSAISINSWDWEWLIGKPFEYRILSGLFKPKHEKLHGCDIAGKVEKVGKNVVNLKVGDEVFGDISDSGWGAYSEYVCVSENQLKIKPLNMTFEQAACLSHGGNLAVQGLIDYGKIKSGQKVLINGGGGATGTLAIQIAKLFDVELTAVDNTAKLDAMRSLGADHVIDYTKQDFTKTGQKYDLIFDVKTIRSAFDYRRVLSPNGTYVTVGGKSSRIFQALILSKLLKKQKMSLVMYKPNKDLNYLIKLFEENKLKLNIDKRFPFDKTPDAFRYFEQGTFIGKVVIIFGSQNPFVKLANQFRA